MRGSLAHQLEELSRHHLSFGVAAPIQSYVAVFILEVNDAALVIALERAHFVVTRQVDPVKAQKLALLITKQVPHSLRHVNEQGLSVERFFERFRTQWHNKSVA